MRGSLIGVLLLAAPGLALAIDCSSANVPQAVPLRPTVLAPISSDLVTPTYQLGAQGSVLSQAYDESQSVDQVLLRLRIEGCQNVAKAIPAPSAINPNDPAAYKPQTSFDNTPWRFDMSQNGKRMTAEEFDAWMKSRGVRIAKGGVAAPVATAPAIAVPAAATMPGAAPGSAPTTGATEAAVPSVKP
ncbi:MAG: hypothetical protein ACREO8_08150 [Luteimonas sp.]